jgi:hypothetical protein
MKHLLLNKNLVHSILILSLLGSVLIFQAQVPNHVFNDDDLLIEQPTRESYSHFKSPNTELPDVITVNDYDNFDVSTDNWENHVTTNPNNPLWLFFGVNASPQNARGTTDGGLNWYLNNPQYPGGTCCDPWTTYTGNGVLIYASGVNGQYIYRSTNNGLNWGPAILSVSGFDRNIVVAEETGTGPYANYVYAAETPGNFARSTNAGLNWQQTFTASNPLPGCYIAVGPNGSTNGGCVIYLTNTGTVASRIYNFYRSTNGGENFTLMSSINVVGYVGSINTVNRMVINGARTNPHPKIAMDNSNGPFRGRLYLVYATNDPPGNGNKPDIWLQYSTDQGATWSSRVIVNDNPNPQQSDQWFPEIWCEKTTGRLYIHWYDDRENPANYSTNIYSTYTTNGGASFVPSVRLTNETWAVYPNPPCNPNTNCYRGDYTGKTANPLTSFSIWADHRAGHSAKNMGAFFPDFAMRVTPAAIGLNNQSDSAFANITVPSVKLYTDMAKFRASVSPSPGTGTISFSFLNKTANVLQDSLAAYPDSLRLRITTSGGVTSGVYTVSIIGAGSNGTPVHKRTISLNVNPVGLTQNGTGIPNEFALYQNYPNPFNPSTRIRFDVPPFTKGGEEGFVTLTVYDILGKVVSVLISENLLPGKYDIEFDGGGLSSGIYFYKLETDGFVDVKKMLIVK